MNDLWRTQFGSDPAIVGKTVTFNGYPYTVIGVMPADVPSAVCSILCHGTAHPQPIEAIVPMVFSKEIACRSDGRLQLFRPGAPEARCFPRRGQRRNQFSPAHHPVRTRGRGHGHHLRSTDALSAGAGRHESHTLADSAGRRCGTAAGGLRQHCQPAFVAGRGPPPADGRGRRARREPRQPAAHGHARNRAAGRPRRQLWAFCLPPSSCRSCSITCLPNSTSAEHCIWTGPEPPCAVLLSAATALARGSHSRMDERAHPASRSAAHRVAPRRPIPLQQAPAQAHWLPLKSPSALLWF